MILEPLSATPMPRPIMVKLERGGGRWSAELCDGVCNAHPFSKRQDADFSLEDVDVDFEKNIS